MCRLAFLSGREQTSDAPGAFPGNLGADVLGMQTFFAVPVLAAERTIGTICGASRRVVVLDDGVLHMMRLVARAIAVDRFTGNSYDPARPERLRADERARKLTAFLGALVELSMARIVRYSRLQLQPTSFWLRGDQTYCDSPRSQQPTAST